MYTEIINPTPWTPKLSTLYQAYWNYQPYFMYTDIVNPTMHTEIINRTSCIVKLSTLLHVNW
jgi:hypothetical protein